MLKKNDQILNTGKLSQVKLYVFVCPIGGNQDGKFSVGFRTGVVRTVVGLDRETQASYRLVIEAIGELHIGVKTIGYACVSAHVV